MRSLGRLALLSTLTALTLAGIGAALAACNASTPRADDRGDAEAEAAATTSVDSFDAGDSAATEPALPTALPVHEGSSITLAREGDRLYIADEDHSMLRIVPLEADGIGRLPPRGANKLIAHEAIALPGRPANIVVTEAAILVTVRDPGLLVAFRRDGSRVVEAWRTPLPADAWGLAVSPDEKTAIVTSAWTHQVSSIDLETHAVVFSVDVAREPRGVVVRSDGSGAYVSHLTSLTGSDLTRIDGLRAPKPKVRRVGLPAARLRAQGRELRASLGYSLALSPDGRRLYVPRHALGATGDQAWFGATTVDVLLTTKDEPLAPKRTAAKVARMENAPPHRMVDSDAGPFPMTPPVSFVSPRTIRAHGDTLYILSEGMHAIYSAPAHTIDPALAATSVATTTCTAPSGMEISPDKKFAYVFCRAPYAVEAVALYGKTLGVTTRPLADDLLSADAARGREIFHDASNPDVSGGLACAGCHPEGRDDAHVWHEIETQNTAFSIPDSVEPRVFVGSEDVAGVRGFPRQTPMLAARVKAEGPYGWHAENPDLRSRIEEGIHLHRWNAGRYDEAAMAKASRELAAYLREGLVPPPREKRALTEIEERGKKIFDSDETSCATCHAPAKDFTDRSPRVLRPWPAAPGFDDEPEGSGFKPPSLFFVGGSAPYYHDGSAATLEELVEKNDDRMGKTKHLSTEERAALVAYLRTL